MKGKKRYAEAEVVWLEMGETLTLEGEPVLEYSISWPEVRGAGLGGKWISRYYRRLAECWKVRWRTRVYWLACLSLARCREESRPFVPWKGELQGKVTFLRDGLLSLKLEGEEIREPGRPCRVCWGDSWKVREGAPCLPGELPGLGKGWKKRARKAIVEQGRAGQSRGEFFPDEDWEEKLRRRLPIQGLYMTQEGVELALPQSVLASGAEGTPTFLICPKET